MNLLLADKVVVISGSSWGIGKGIAATLLQEGCRVVLTGRDAQDVKIAAQEFESIYPGKVISFAGDLLDQSVLECLAQKVLSTWGCVDCLVANAGAVKPVDGWNIPAEDWDWYMRANFDVAVRFVQRFIPLIVETRGSIVFIGSIAGLEDIGAPLPYSAGKAAVTMYAKGLARKLASQNVRVNCVAPGNVIFPGGSWDKKYQANRETVDDLLKTKVPMNRFGTPEEVGAACAFLLSEKSSFTTGACFVVDGGQTSLFI